MMKYVTVNFGSMVTQPTHTQKFLNCLTKILSTSSSFSVLLSFRKISFSCITPWITLFILKYSLESHCSKEYFNTLIKSPHIVNRVPTCLKVTLFYISDLSLDRYRLLDRILSRPLLRLTFLLLEVSWTETSFTNRCTFLYFGPRVVYRTCP